MMRRHSEQGARLPARSGGILIGSSHCGQLNSMKALALAASVGASDRAASASASRSMGTALAATGAGTPLAVGTVTGALHLLHLPCLPARASGTVMVQRHFGLAQVKVIGMVSCPWRKAAMGNRVIVAAT